MAKYEAQLQLLVDFGGMLPKIFKFDDKFGRDYQVILSPML